MPIRTMTVDVDLTLIDDKGDIYPGVRDKLEEWKAKYTLICWSHGGKEHAQKMCKKNKIDKFFSSFMDKPDIIVDNEPESILTFPAIIHIQEPKKDWSKCDNDLFAGAREWKKRLKVEEV